MFKETLPGYKKICIFVFFVFFILRVWGIQFGLPYDGIHPTEHFSISAVIDYLTTGDLKPRDFQHPALFQYLISLIARVTRLPVENYPYLYLSARLISCLASLLSVYFLYRLAKDLFKQDTLALLCASFLGFNLLSIKYSHYAVPDSLCLLFVVLTIWSALKILNDSSLKTYLSCGIFCGLSIASKFSGLISLGFLLGAYLLKEKKRLFAPNKIVLSLLLVFLIFLLASPYHIFYLKEAIGDFDKYLAEKGYSASGSFRSSGFFTYPFILLPDVFGFLGLFFSLAGLGVLFLKDRRKAFLLAVPSLLYFLIIGKEHGGSIQNVLVFLPTLSILAAHFFLFLKETGVRNNLIVVLGILSLLPQLARAALFDHFLFKKDTRILAQEWLLKNVKEKTKIGFERYSPFDLNYIGKSAASEKFDATYFVPSLSLYPASFYKTEGYGYIITSNFRRDSYVFFCKTDKQCQPINNYSSYDTQLELAAVFLPPRIFRFTGVSLPWGTWPHNPVVRIYRVMRK